MLGYPVALDRYVAWGETSGAGEIGDYVIDVDSGEAFTVGDGGFYGAAGAGDILSWTEDAGGPVEVIVRMKP